jgi:DNA-binding protein HU-beta
MNKTHLIESIAVKAEITKQESHKALDALLDTIIEALNSHGEIGITGFGTFKISHRAARDGFNPLTKLPISISASKIPTFKAGKTLKEAVK